jgi:hypothetical protein
MKWIYLVICLSALNAVLPSSLWAQEKKDSSVMQFSGLVLTEEYNQLIPVPFTTIYVENTRRGTYSDMDGFFSLVVKTGETVVFSSIGFETIRYKIPDTLSANRYTVYQLMTKDTILLPETVVYPWPSREHYKIEFLKMDVSNELASNMMDNLSAENMEKARRALPNDGIETGNLYLRQMANERRYTGQLKPMNVLSPLAWKEFFDAWKAGKFKRQDD